MSHLRLALVLVVILGVVGGCSRRNTDADTASEIPVQPIEKRKPRVLGTLPRFRFKDQSGKVLTSERLNGKVWVATFFFTRCQATCPAQTAEFAKLQRLMANHPASSDLRLVSITVDPEYDTPSVLADYARQADADPERWSFVTAPRDVIHEISEKGFKLPFPQQGSSSGPIAHSQNFILVDRVRRIRGYYDGLDATARQRLMQDLEIVLTDPAGPITERKQPDHALQAGPRVYVPLEVKDPPWLAERAAAQKLAMQQANVFHDFLFQDKQPESGITFVNRVVDDAAKDYKGVHYDHGNGVAIADINNDGRYDIYFVNQLGDNELYQNLGDGKFQNITEQAGVAVANRIGVTASFADIDNDGDADLFTTVRGGNVLFENDGTGRFTDISSAAGLDYVGHSSSAVFFDYDRDGLLDMFLTNPGVYTSDETRGPNHFVGYVDAFSGHLKPERSEQSILYRNLGDNRFQDVSAEVGLLDESWAGAASPVDVNQDGWLDLYVLSMQGHDEYYENQAGRRFLNRSREVFPRTPWGAMGIKVFDFDNDQHLDIFITDMHTDMIDEALGARRFWHAEKMKMTDQYGPRYLKTDGNHILGNAFFHNQGNGTFQEISDDIGVETYWPWGLSVGDLNADGFEDIFITGSMNYPYRYAVNSLLLNEEGKLFRDSEFVLGVEPRRDRRTCQPWFELDCDGTDAQHELSQGRQGTIEVWGALGSRSSVVFDLDDDGDLDIVTNEFHSAPMVLVSNLADKLPDLHYLSIQLQGTQSNRGGLGATVQIKAGKQSMIKVQDGQSGYLSQSIYPLYFGLGDAPIVDEINVTWTTGKRQVLGGPIETNRVLTIVEE